MKLQKIIILLTILLLSLVNLASAHEKKWPEKRLRQTWADAGKFTSKQISLSSTQIAQLASEGVKINSEEKSPTFYFVHEKNKTIGTIFFVDEYGDNGSMEISVAMGVDGLVKKVDIWEHSENALVAKEDFLKQFLGKTAKDSFVVNKDYKIIQNAPMASEAVARAVVKALKITNIIFAKK